MKRKEQAKGNDEDWEIENEPEETEEKTDKRKKIKNYGKINMATVTTRKYHQKTDKEMGKQTLQKTDTDRNREERKPHDQPIIQNALEYADDAKLFIEKTHM